MTKQGDMFDRSVEYWIERAERVSKAGDLKRAAVLARHAARMEPYSAEAGACYAVTLNRLNCFWASNREAFRAVNADPERRELYGLIGMNMAGLGRKREAQDAFRMYCVTHLERYPDWAFDAYGVWDTLVRRSHGRARFEGLLSIAMNRIQRGEFEAAERALKRTQERPYEGPSVRRELVWTAYLKARGRTDEALSRLRAAVREGRYGAHSASLAAILFHELGQEREAGNALLLAAHKASRHADETTVCIVCEELGKLDVAYSMLKRAYRRHPVSYPVCYNLAIVLLKMGQLEEAEGYMHLCREIDPDDIPGEVVFNRMREIDDDDPESVREEARGFGFYGLQTRVDIERIIGPVLTAMGNEPEALGGILSRDENLRQRFLYFLTLDVEWAGGMLELVSGGMPEDKRERLLREILVTTPENRDLKRMAMYLLYQMNIKPPYLVWEKERLMMVDPRKDGNSVPTLAQRAMARKIQKAAELAESRELIPWAIQLMHTMCETGRALILMDKENVWPIALAMYFTRIRNLPPVPLTMEFFKDRPRMSKYLEALAMVETEAEVHGYC